MHARGGLITAFVLCILLAALPAPRALPVAAATATGRILHVDPDGDDAADGTAARPWRTIQRATADLAPGDTIEIAPGSYAGGIVVATAGTAAAPITLRGTGAAVVIDGSGAERDALLISEADYVVVERLTIRRATRAGLRVSLSHHVTIRDSIFANNGTWGIFTDFSDDLLIEGNESFGAGEEHGIYVSNSGDRPILRGNRVHDNYAGGIQLNADATMGGDGIISGALIEANVIYGNGAGGGGAINLDGVEASVLRNNLLYDNHASGITLFQQDGAICSRDNVVVNNTIVMPEDARWAVFIGPAGSDCRDNTLINNIILSAHPTKGSITISDPALTGFVSDYNLLGDRFSGDDEASVLSLAEWQALGFDRHSRLATPEELFRDPEGGDFRLLPGSPAIDTGAEPPVAVLVDLDGTARPAGAGYDVGAYELAASAADAGRRSSDGAASRSTQTRHQGRS